MALPVTSITHSFELACAAESATASLPVPEFGNVRTVQATRIFRRTLGATLHVLRDANWYKLNIFEYAFRNVSESDKDDFIDFVEIVGSQVCEVTDHMGIERNFYITVVEPIVETKDDSCTYDFSITFQEVS